MTDDYVPDYALIARYAPALLDFLLARARERPGEPFTVDQVVHSNFPLDRADDVEMLLAALERLDVVTRAGLDGQRRLVPDGRWALRRARGMVDALAATAAGYVQG